MLNFLQKSWKFSNFLIIFCLINIINARNIIKYSDYCTSKVCSNLNINVNDYFEIDIPEDQLMNMLAFDNSTINEIPIKFFEGLSHLRDIDLRDSSVQRYNILSFYKLEKLKILLLSNNEITKLPDAGFSELYDLESLWLDYNNINDMNPQSFYRLTKLRILSLEGNSINELPNGIFNELINLNTLYLNKNQLKIIDNGIFDKCQKLSLIDFFGNEIMEIGKDVFIEIPKIDVVRLTENQIENLILNFNEIENLYAENAMIKNINLNGTVRLLSLRDNKITNYKFSNIWEIVSLDLSNNSINNLENLRLGYDLNELNLSENPLRTINSKTFTNMRNLKRLDLSSTKLQYLQFGIFNQLNNLEVLDIANNKLTDLNIEIFESIHKLKYLYIHNNPYYCPAIELVINKLLHPRRISYMTDSAAADDDDLIVEKNTEMVQGIRCKNSIIINTDESPTINNDDEDAEQKSNNYENHELEDDETIMKKQIDTMRNDLKTIVQFYDMKFDKIFREIEEMKRRQNLQLNVDEKFWNKVSVYSDN